MNFIMLNRIVKFFSKNLQSTFLYLFTVNNVRSRWKSLRDNFRISIKRMRKCNNEGLTRLKSWKYHEEMEFLLPFMQING